VSPLAGMKIASTCGGAPFFASTDISLTGCIMPFASGGYVFVITTCARFSCTARLKACSTMRP